MPTKRKTMTTRRKAKLPEGNEGRDLSADERQQKLDFFLQEFDQEVKCRLEKMRNEAKNLCGAINHFYKLELCKIPKDMKNMKRSDFLKAGGAIDALQMKAADEIVDSMARSIQSTIKSKPTMVTANASNYCETIIEEGEEDDIVTPLPGRKRGRKQGKKKADRRAVLAESSNPPPSTARGHKTAVRRTVGRYQTPAMKGGPGMAGWETPLVTPKFDPRLPVTPMPGLTREPKPGEWAMSLAGSPLITKPPKQKGKDLINNMDLNELEDLPTDEETMLKLSKLHATLSKIIKTHRK